MTLVTPQPNGATTTGREIEDLSANFGETKDNIEDLRGKTGEVKTQVENARWALEQVEEIETQATEFIATIKSMKFSLKLSEKVGPLKLPSKFVVDVLDQLEDVARQVRDKAKSMAKKIEDGQYIEKLEEAEEKLEEVEEDLEELEGQVEEYKGSVDSTIFAFDFIGPALGPAEALANFAATPVNDVLVPINTAYNELEERVEALQEAFSITNVANVVVNLFEDLATVAASFGAINSSLSFLKGPLEAVQTALAPIEWVLDAVGLVYDLTVGPVVDFLLDTLGITDIMDRLGEEISKVLPEVNVLDAMEARIDATFADLGAFLGGWDADLTGYVDDLTQDVVDALNAASPDALRFGNEEANTLFGRGAEIDILNGLEGNDTLYGYENTSGASAAAATEGDVFIASSGEDFYFGGAGSDYLVLRGFLSDFRITQFSDTAPVIFLDELGRWGREVAEGIEMFIFTDGAFTLQELKDLGALAPAETDGDDLIIGGDDDDLIAPLDGSDTIDGRDGSDTILFPDRSGARNVTVELDSPRTDDDDKTYEGFAWDSRDRSFLDSIENAIVETDRASELRGNGEANLLVTGGGTDTLRGEAGNDTLFGADNRDLLIGGLGQDEVFGGDGDDTLVAGPVEIGKGETYDGGDGTLDILSYSTSDSFFRSEIRQEIQQNELDRSGPLIVDIGAGIVDHMDGDAILATDRFTGIESFIGSDEDDVITGAQSDTPDARMRINGADGDDTIYTGGADIIDGGNGSDTVILTNISGDIQGGDQGSTTDILDLRQFDDVRWLFRNAQNNKVDFTAFAPFEVERLGTASGEVADRSLVTLGDGSFEGFEQVFLGNENDEFYTQGSARVEIFAAGGDDYLARTSATSGGATFFHGGDGDDILKFTARGNAAYGDAGDDRLEIETSESEVTLEGGAGDDFIRITRVNGTLDGGDGYDVLSFEGISNAYRSELDLTLGTASSFFRNAINRDQEIIELTNITGIEEVIGAETDRDVFYGSENGERLLGRGNTDTLNGRGGNDELFGGDGNDSLNGGEGEDLLHGGAGNDRLIGGFVPDEVDTASYANARFDGEEGATEAGDFGAVIVDLALGTATGAQGNDTLTEIENVIGSSAGDTLRGDGEDNMLSGGAGDDLLEGRDGDDVLVLGAGSDTANGGNGDDRFIIGLGDAVVDGGDGIDVVDFGSVSGAISFNFETFTYEANLLTDVAVWRDGGGIEVRVWNGTPLTPQEIIETEAAFANSADDLTRAVPGADDPNITDFEVVFVQVSQNYSGTFENVEELSTGSGDDTILGFNNDEVLVGAAGNDLLNGGRGNDTLLGETGDDDMSGGVGEDSMESGEGHDTLRGGIGEDTLIGAAGNDVMRGQRNADTLEGGDGADNLKGGGGNDFLDGGSGVDFLKGGTRADLIHGGADNDKLFGNSFGDTLFGEAGNDLLNAGGDDDELTGGTGNDTLKGGSGADAFFFDLGHETDRILDFEVGIDTLHLTVALTQGLINAQEILDTFGVDLGGESLLDFGNGDTILLRRIQAPDDLLNDLVVTL